MKKSVLFLVSLLFLLSCSDKVDIDENIYGTWEPVNNTGLIYVFNPDNTGKIYYIQKYQEEDNAYFCDACKTITLKEFSFGKHNGLYEIHMFSEDGDTYNEHIESLTPNSFIHSIDKKSFVKKTLEIVEMKFSCK